MKDALKTRIKLSIPGLLAFICGAVNDISFEVVGELYLSELLVFVSAIFVTVFYRSRLPGQRIFWAFLFAAWATLAGYVLSDLYVGTLPQQYFRGWGRAFILLINCWGVMILARQNRQNLWWFILGMGLGGILYLYLNAVPFTIWKIGYGDRLAFILVAMMALFPKILWAVLLTSFGLLNIWLDYRSMGAFFILVAMMIWIRGKMPVNSLKPRLHWGRVIIAGSLGLIVILGGLVMTEELYSDRRAASNSGRSAAVIVSLRAIADSPIIGYGSWTINKKYANELRQEARKQGREAGAKPGSTSSNAGSGFQSHSQILQSWVEGGILGASFFLFFGYKLLQTMYWGAIRRPVDIFTPAFMFVLILGLWNLIASPFLGFGRVQIALAVGVIVAMSIERRSNIKEVRAP